MPRMPRHFQVSHHHGFYFIWLFSSLVFFCLAFDSFQNIGITLPKSNEELQRGFMAFGGPTGANDVGEVVDSVIESHNESVEKLQESIRGTATTSFVLNLLSGVVAFGGFLTQMRAEAYENRQEHNGTRSHDQNAEPQGTGEKTAEIKEGGQTDEDHGNAKSIKARRWYDRIWGVHVPKR